MECGTGCYSELVLAGEALVSSRSAGSRYSLARDPTTTTPGAFYSLAPTEVLKPHNVFQT